MKEKITHLYFLFLAFVPFGLDGLDGLLFVDEENKNNEVIIDSENLSAGLSGIYTIGGSAPDYADFTAVVVDLELNGVSGSVTFNVRDGIYNEQIGIGEIVGADTTSQIVFQSESGDSSLVTLTYAATVDDNFTVHLDGADWVTFKNMTIEATDITYGRVVVFSDSSFHNSFENNVLRGISPNSSSSLRAIVYCFFATADYNSFVNNKFEDGSYGVYWRQNDAMGLHFQNNYFQDQYYVAIYMRDIDAPQIIENTITTNSNYSGSTGIYLYRCTGGTKIAANTIYGTYNNSGLYLYLSTGLAADEVLIANNFIQIDGTGNGHGIFSRFGDYENLFYNTVHVLSKNTSKGALYIDAGSNISLLNNNLVNTGAGYAIITSTTPITSSDHNNLYADNERVVNTGGKVLDLNGWQTVSSMDVNSMSVNPDFLVVNDPAPSNVDLNATATPIASLPMDIEGDLRDPSSPDIGAVEFIPANDDAALLAFTEPVIAFAPGTLPIKVVLKNNGAANLTNATIDWEINETGQTTYNWTGSLASGERDTFSIGTVAFAVNTFYNLKAWSSNPNNVPDLFPLNDTIYSDSLYAGLIGTYTIGGTSPDFNTLSEATDALELGGAAGAVTFNIRNGVYTEQVFINEITGASSANTVTFQSETGDSSVVTIDFSAPLFSDATLMLNGADWIRFRNVTIKALSTTNNRVVYISGGSNNLEFTNCYFDAAIQGGYDNFYIHLDMNDHITLRNNHFKYGKHGAGIYGFTSSGVYADGIVVENNIFEDQSKAGAWIFLTQNLLVKNNRFSGSDEHGLHVRTGSFGEISGNEISDFAEHGLFIEYVSGDATTDYLIANNFIYSGKSTATNGIYTSNGDYQGIYHNSVNIYGGQTYANAIRNNNGSNKKIKNNIFCNLGGGRVYSLNNYTSVVESDYNDLFTNGSVFGNVFGNRADFSTWKAQTGQDDNSLSTDPLFISNTDLHTFNSLLKNAGTSIPEVTTDFDGNGRHPLTPDIGADEFFPNPVDAGMVDIDQPVMPFALGLQVVTGTVINNGADTLKNVLLNWSVNGVVQPVASWTGQLITGESEDSILMGDFLFPLDSVFNLKAWVSEPNGVMDPLNTNDTVHINNLQAGLSGFYSIGGTNPDFIDFQSAVAALVGGGVAGPVTFLVRDGIYNEQISIPEILGMDSINTVTFQSESADSSKVKLTYHSLSVFDNYVVFLDGADYFVFRDLSFHNTSPDQSNVIAFFYGATHNSFFNNEVIGYDNPTSGIHFLVSSNGWTDEYNVFKYNRFIDGGTAIRHFGNASIKDKGNVFSNNIFEGQKYSGIDLNFQNAPIVENNEFTTSTFSDYNAIIARNCSNDLSISNNYIYDINKGAGISLEDCIGSSSSKGLISNNFIAIGEGNSGEIEGIHLEDCTEQNIYHNSVRCMGDTTFNFYNVYGCYISNSTEITIKNNIFSATGSTETSYAIFKSGGTITSDFNDLFVPYGVGNMGYFDGVNSNDLSAWQASSGQDNNSYSIDPKFVSSSDLHVSEVDLNNNGTPLTAVTTDFDGEPRNTSNPDIGADEFFPMTVNDIALEKLFPNKETPFPTGVQPIKVVMKNSGSNTLLTAKLKWKINNIFQPTYHWTGNLKSGKRDTVIIGQVHFSANTEADIICYSEAPNDLFDTNPTNDTVEVKELYPALSGTYTIGGSLPDFPNFGEAANALNKGGVTGQVVLNVRNGTYEEAFSINEITGTDSTNTVTFQSEVGDSSTVKIVGTNLLPLTNMVELNGADYFTFQYLTFELGGSTSSPILEFKNGAENNTITNCHFIGPSYSSNQPIIISNGNSLDNHNLIANNFLENGGVSLSGRYSFLLESGNVIQNNILHNFNGGIIISYFSGLGSLQTDDPGFSFLYQDGLVVNGNEIHIANEDFVSSNAYALDFSHCENDFVISNNKIHTDGAGGIRKTATTGTGMVFNNFISLHGEQQVFGIRSSNAPYTDFLFNSVNCANTNEFSSAFFARSFSYITDSVSVLNNIFSNTGGGYCIFLWDSTEVGNIDYNNYYNEGNNFGWMAGQVANNLSSWQSLTNDDLNSINVNPLFVSDTNLHTLQMALDSSAIPITAIGNDIDGEPRNPNYPDIGADESEYPESDIGISRVLQPENDCDLSNEEVVKILVTNHGTQPQTGFDVAYQLNAATAVIENVGPLSVPPGGTAEFSFTSTVDLSNHQIHQFKFYTSLNGDENLQNDTLIAEMLNAELPAVITDMVPADGSVDIDKPINFSWFPADGATQYELFLWKQGIPQPLDPSVEDLQQIVYANNSDTLEFGATYEWQVFGDNGYCKTPGTVQSFTLRELPDLIAKNVTVPNSPFSGQSIEVSWEVENVGLGTTGMDEWYDYIYLSADNAFQPELDIYLGGFKNFTSLNALEAYPNMKNVMLPASTQGTHYIIVVTDADDDLKETNEANNTSIAASMMVNLSPPPDLVVDSLIVPSNVFSGTSFLITWQTKNQGNGDTPFGQDVKDYIYLSENEDFDPLEAELLGISSLPTGTNSISVNDKAARSRYISISENEIGFRYIHVVTDQANDVFEHVFEDNNITSSTPINVILSPAPDLVPKSLSLSKDTVSDNGVVAVQWQVENKGTTLPNYNGFSDRVFISDQYPFAPSANIDSFDVKHGFFNEVVEFPSGTSIVLDCVTFGCTSYNCQNLSMDNGDSISQSSYFLIPDKLHGKHYFYVQTDIYDCVYESIFENNNLAFVDSVVVVNPDLIVNEINIMDTVYSCEQTVVNWAVKNDGLGSAILERSDGIYLSLSPDNNSSLTTLVDSLAYSNNISSGDTLWLEKEIMIPNGFSGKYYVHIAADIQDNVFENSNENNNLAVDSFQVNLSPWADLQCDTLYGLPDSTTAGSLTTLTYTVQNHGQANISGIENGWRDYIYISPMPTWDPANAVFLKSISIQQPVDMGSTYTRTTSFNIPMLGNGAANGICYIYVFTDGGNAIYEHTDEANNVIGSNPISVSAPSSVDFDALNATPLPDTLWSGQQINLQWSVQNIGSTTELWEYPLWYDGVYLCEDSIWHPHYEDFIKDFTQQGPIGNGVIYEHDQTFKIPNDKSGDFYFFVVADHTNLTNDGADSNNVQKIRPSSHPTGQFKPIHIKLSPSPNLTITSFNASSDGISGQPIQVIYTVKNTGTGMASGGWSDKVYLSTNFEINNEDPIIASKLQTRVLQPVESYTDTLEVTLPVTASGNYILIFKTDANNSLFELNGEMDNESYKYHSTFLASPSDLVVDSISFNAMGMVGNQFSVYYNIKNQGINPASGIMRDLVYLSADSVFDASDVLFKGPIVRNLDLAPVAVTSKIATNEIPGVPLGDYFVIVQTDALNNIFENSETNNVTISANKVTVTVKELPLNIWSPDTLSNGENIYCRIEIPDSLAGETMQVSLLGDVIDDPEGPDSLRGINELYLSYGQMPTASEHEFSFQEGLATDQTLIVPSVQAGTYYLLTKGNMPTRSFFDPMNGFTTVGGIQNIELKAEIIPFEIRSVDDVVGGNTGNVTIRLDGAKFTEDMEVRLEDGTLGTHIAHTLSFISSTRIYATFNLSDANLGIYDVTAERDGETASLADGFEVVAGGAGTTTGTGGAGVTGFFCSITNIGTDQELAQNISHPSAVRVNRVVPITIEFGNAGNVDIPCPSRFLMSLRGAPLTFDADDFSENKQELFLEFNEPGGPPGILRPGAIGSITVYAFSSHPLFFYLAK